MKEKTGFVWLIGAGCGGADLITVRGLERLRRCGVVVYDDLIDGALLDEAPREAERIYMGKRRGRHSAPQEEISRVLVERALAGCRVARLKGGDPFVFGRGGEEAQALREAGIPFEVVPGISSAIAIPAAAGIPVTHRNVSRSFHVVTGHTAAGGLPEEMYSHLASLGGTLVFLMGLSRLEEIAGKLLDAGMPPETPAAVVSGGNAAYPVTVRAGLCEIAGRARAAAVRSPAVIVVGGTAALDLTGAADGELSGMAECLREDPGCGAAEVFREHPSGGAARPLEGVRVGVTGTDRTADRLREALEPLGARVLRAERALVEALPLELDIPALFRDRRWLVFTSGNGVEVFFRRLAEERVDLRRMGCCKLAVIGGATGEALERHGFLPDLCPRVYTGAALAGALGERMEAGEDAVLLRCREASPLLPELLERRGIPARDVPLYTVRSVPGETVEEPDYLVFGSAGGVERYLRLYGSIPKRAVCVCIGPVTAEALERRYRGAFLTASHISAKGVAETVRRHFERSRKAR